MNLINAATLVMEDVFTIGIQFNPGGKTYTYKCAVPVEVGQEVLVVSPHDGLVSVEVVRVDEFPDIDPNYTGEYKWIYAVVQDVHTTHKEIEAKIAKQLKDAQRQKLRSQARAAILEALGIEHTDVCKADKAE